MKVIKTMMVVILLSVVLSIPSRVIANDDASNYLVYESTDMAAYTEMNIDIVNTTIVIQLGEQYSIDVYLSQDDLEFEELFNIDNNNGRLTIAEKDWKNTVKSILLNVKSHFIITVPEMNELVANIEFINGEITINNEIKELTLDYVNGDTNLFGKDAYPMDIEFINGDVMLEFGRYDADINIEFINGNLNFFGDKSSSRLSAFKRMTGERTHTINIDAVNGSVTIVEQAR
ncbi:hypothetical protein HYQ40_01215 [Aerococcaceae bacterium DSM 111021]|nr:hypothetical protein [Aerococcaceae bacterium DSM 111021]